MAKLLLLTVTVCPLFYVTPTASCFSKNFHLGLVQNTYSDKVQSFIPYRKEGVFLKFLLTAKDDNIGPKTEPMYVNLRT